MSDTELKQTLAKMLPEIRWSSDQEILYWVTGGTVHRQVLDTELLHLCGMVEGTIEDMGAYCSAIHDDFRATWQQRCQALAAVKGVDI